MKELLYQGKMLTVFLQRSQCSQRPPTVGEAVTPLFPIVMERWGE